MKTESNKQFPVIEYITPNWGWRIYFNKSIINRTDPFTNIDSIFYCADFVDIKQFTKAYLIDELKKNGYNESIANDILSGKLDHNGVIYLSANTRDELISDIQNVFTYYNGETEYSCHGCSIHYIGDIPIENADPVTGEITITMVGKQHANIYVPDEFDETKFTTRLPVAPDNPYNVAAV